MDPITLLLARKLSGGGGATSGEITAISPELGADIDEPAVSASYVDVVEITDSNISTYFDVTNNEYYFAYSDGYWKSNNQDVNGSTAKSVWSAKGQFLGCILEWSVSSEVCDYFRLSNGANQIVYASGENSGSYSDTIDGSITMEYAKDWGARTGDDTAKLKLTIVVGS